MIGDRGRGGGRLETEEEERNGRGIEEGEKVIHSQIMPGIVIFGKKSNTVFKQAHIVYLESYHLQKLQLTVILKLSNSLLT